MIFPFSVHDFKPAYLPCTGQSVIKFLLCKMYMPVFFQDFKCSHGGCGVF